MFFVGLSRTCSHHKTLPDIRDPFRESNFRAVIFARSCFFSRLAPKLEFGIHAKPPQSSLLVNSMFGFRPPDFPTLSEYAHILDGPIKKYPHSLRAFSLLKRSQPLCLSESKTEFVSKMGRSERARKMTRHTFHFQKTLYPPKTSYVPYFTRRNIKTHPKGVLAFTLIKEPIFGLTRPCL